MRRTNGEEHGPNPRKEWPVLSLANGEEHGSNPKGGAGSHKVVEFGCTKEARGGGSLLWLLCWRLQEAKKKKRSKMKRERRRGGIYKGWIWEVMQIKKGKGVFCKMGEI